MQILIILMNPRQNKKIITCRRDLRLVLSIHIVCVVKELGDVVSVLLSQEPYGVIAWVVAAAGPATGQEEKEKSETPHSGHQQPDWHWQRCLQKLCGIAFVVPRYLKWLDSF